MSETPDPADLVSATQTLAERVHELGEKLALSEQSQREIKAHQVEIQSQARQQAINVKNIEEQAARQKFWIRLQAVCGVLLLLCVVWLWNVAQDAKDAAHTATAASKAVKANAVTSCENGNSRTAGQTLLWDTLLNKSLELNRAAGASKKDIQQLLDLRTLENRIFAPRDCAHLNKKYRLPEVPSSLRTK